MSAMISEPIRLVLSDVDGTLLNENKVLTARARAAVERLKIAGIGFTITSGRTPMGLLSLSDSLALQLPITGNNGAVMTTPDGSLLESFSLPTGILPELVAAIEEEGLDAWVYRQSEWLLRRAEGRYLGYEIGNLGYPPVVVPELEHLTGSVEKVLAVGDDPAMEKCQRRIVRDFSDRVRATRSQPFFLDITALEANKGNGLLRLAKRLEIAPTQIATIGDMENDLSMFRQSGLSIAMGNAAPEIQQMAMKVTASNEEEGFARAIEDFILKR
jgi:Cof subfamily protein (haloacid dehalogenase superfamily)